MTVKEFEIFSLLILNPKRVFTYEMLMELVWEEDYTYYSRKAVWCGIKKVDSLFSRIS
ncbi:hypothetical protein K280104A7_24080 [Candidatus Bariatricus faecipullorum]